jgi:hypothetical protein
MKTKIIATVVLISLGANAFGQQVETDDMYFNSKDRAKLKEKATVVAYADAKPKEKKIAEYADEVNPTDSYSARNINPEYSARSQAEVAQEENGDYFVNNYKYQTADKLNTWNNDFNSWYGNSMYNNSYYSNNMYGWNSPYYGSYYNNFGSPWTNPYYQSMLSSSFSFYWGNNWNYGWGVGYNNYCNPYNSMWGSPYTSYGYASSYGNPYYYNPYGWGGYQNYYPAVVVVERNKYNTFEMRNSRSSNLAASNPQGSSRSGITYTDQNQPRNVPRSSSRTEYYDRNWRYQTPPSNGSSTSTYSNSTGENTFSNPPTNGSRNSWNNTSDSNSRYTPSNSGYDGGGSRSSSSSSPSSGGSHSSGGGSRSRGR